MLFLSNDWSSLIKIVKKSDTFAIVVWMLSSYKTSVGISLVLFESSTVLGCFLIKKEKIYTILSRPMPKTFRLGMFLSF
jgi:hypothetical protein